MNFVLDIIGLFIFIILVCNLFRSEISTVCAMV